ncbi:4164_t:CDS:2 [Funneliformis geosporum]|uniref:1669_t:CDS:1 n=1 Tax=Funneliformis geosporum TaxID=1117311 RepID=A0A9W4WTV1_9GLOM|nr:1669_t:CDS:2 [Funneliformis geosporum]CAI2167218.1 4164_t:CDS:2 [Funneliformis geosporum]
MVRLLNNFTRVCKTTEEGEEICSCDYRVNLYDCPHSEFYVLMGKILIALCTLATIMSGAFLFYLIKIKKQPFFLNNSRGRGWLRPRPLHSYHLIVFTYMFFEGLHLILLINESYPNIIAAEIGNVMINVCTGAISILYPISIVYSTPNIRNDYEQSNIRNFSNELNPRMVDAIGIILFLQPIISWLPLASLTGHYAELNDIEMANTLFMAHYLAYVFWEIMYIMVLAYFWFRLMSVIKNHLMVLEQHDSNKKQVRGIKRGTKNLTIPVMAIFFGLLLQSIIYVIMSFTYRNKSIYYFVYNVSYYWMEFVSFPLLGIGIESALIYNTFMNLRKPTHSTGLFSSSSTHSKSNIVNSLNSNVMDDHTASKFSVIASPTVIHCSETIEIQISK